MSLESGDPHDSGVRREKIESWENSWKTSYFVPKQVDFPQQLLFYVKIRSYIINK